MHFIMQNENQTKCDLIHCRAMSREMVAGLGIRDNIHMFVLITRCLIARHRTVSARGLHKEPIMVQPNRLRTLLGTICPYQSVVE